jgi:hypothetical protein
MYPTSVKCLRCPATDAVPDDSEGVSDSEWHAAQSDTVLPELRAREPGRRRLAAGAVAGCDRVPVSGLSNDHHGSTRDEPILTDRPRRLDSPVLAEECPGLARLARPLSSAPAQIGLVVTARRHGPSSPPRDAWLRGPRALSAGGPRRRVESPAIRESLRRSAAGTTAAGYLWPYRAAHA